MTIDAIRISDPTTTALKWWSEVPFLKDKEHIPFEPGLNILWGPNGSGKSTALKLIARMLHCHQGGFQKVTATSRREVFENARPPSGARLEYDGLPVMHFDPGHAVGLVGGMAAFDHDFGDEGIANAMIRESSGQSTARRANKLLLALLGREEVPPVTWVRGEPSIKEVKEEFHEWKRSQLERENLETEWLLSTLKGDREPVEGSRPTFLLDEPERSLDLPLQAGFWNRVPVLVYSRGVQVIVATHSPFAVNVPGANYIEFKEGYLEECRRAMNFLWWAPSSEKKSEE